MELFSDRKYYSWWSTTTANSKVLYCLICYDKFPFQYYTVKCSQTCLTPSHTFCACPKPRTCHPVDVLVFCLNIICFTLYIYLSGGCYICISGCFIFIHWVLDLVDSILFVGTHWIIYVLVFYSSWTQLTQLKS